MSKAIFREHFEQIWNNNDASAIERFIAPTYRGFDAAELIAGIEGYKHHVETITTELRYRYRSRRGEGPTDASPPGSSSRRLPPDSAGRFLGHGFPFAGGAGPGAQQPGGDRGSGL